MDRTYCSEECRAAHESFQEQLRLVRDEARDHSQRFDTLQTWWWKRVWFWIDGWPWHDLNGTQRRRPWHRRDGL